MNEYNQTRKEFTMLKKSAFISIAVCLLLLCSCSVTPDTLDESSSSQTISSAPSPEPELDSAPESPSPTLSADLAAEPSPAPELTEREEKWYEDLDYLRDQYVTLHPNPFCYVSEEEFDYQLEQLRNRISELSDADIYFEIEKIVAGFCDPHTVANAPEFVYNRIFPFDVISFGEKTYLYVYGEDYSELLAPYFLREIVAVNGIDMSYIRQKASELFYPTNSWYNKEHFTYLFYLPAFFDWVGCDHQEGYTFHILNEDNQVELVEIPAVQYTPETMERMYNSYPEGFSFPQSFRETATNRAEYVEDERGGYVYLLFSYMKDGHMRTYDEFFDTATALLKNHPNCKLVIDLRKNSGGDSNVQLFTRQRMLDWQTLPIGKTYILTGGFMMSAAIDMNTIFKEELGGITVGEPTGQFPATFGNSKTPRQVVNLPNSQIPIFIADMWWQGMHPEDYLHNENYFPYEWQNTVLPDVYVSMDAEDFRQGKDSVIEWVMEH